MLNCPPLKKRRPEGNLSPSGANTHPKTLKRKFCYSISHKRLAIFVSTLARTDSIEKIDVLVLKRLRKNRFIRNMRCKQRASPFDKSTLLGFRKFLLKIHPKMIFADAIFLLIEKFSAVRFSPDDQKNKNHNFSN